MALAIVQLRIYLIGSLISDIYTTVAENLTVSPKVSFLQDDRRVTLVWRYHSEALLDRHFDGNFVFYHNGTRMKNEGGGPSFVYPGEPFVDYELERIKEPGVFSGKVGNLSATAFVYYVVDEAPVELARDGVDLNLKCKAEPNAWFTLWEVDGVFTDPLNESKFIRNGDGSLTVRKIDLNTALKKIKCHLFVTEADLKSKENKTAILPYKTAVITIPILVYKPVYSNSTCVVKTAAWKDVGFLRLCYARIQLPENATNERCEPLRANSSFQLPEESNFTVYSGNETFLSDNCKAEPEDPTDDNPSPHKDVKPKEELGILVAVLIGLGIVAGVSVLVIVFKVCKSKYMTVGRKQPKANKKAINEKETEAKQADEKEKIGEEEEMRVLVSQDEINIKIEE